MFEDFLVTVTPWRVTSSGRELSAAWTRLLTLMVFWSGLVPTAKVMVMESVPSPELVERM
jgi:hypothetical protein